MAVIDEEIQSLIDLKKRSEKDNIYYKEIIKNKLINNKQIIRSLDNKALDPDCPVDYVGENILPYYLIPDIQDKTKNYICFETSFTEIPRYNNVMKYGQVIFYILCDNKTIYDRKTGIARHDLLATLITDEFNWTNMFGSQINLISDKPMALDYHYVGRTLVFEQTTPNAIVKNGVIYNNSTR